MIEREWSVESGPGGPFSITREDAKRIKEEWEQAKQIAIADSSPKPWRRSFVVQEGELTDLGAITSGEARVVADEMAARTPVEAAKHNGPLPPEAVQRLLEARRERERADLEFTLGIKYRFRDLAAEQNRTA